MQIDRAIHRARGAAIVIEMRANVVRPYDAVTAEGLDDDARAVKAVCDALEATRAENERLQAELKEQRMRRIRRVFEHR